MRDLDEFLDPAMRLPIHGKTYAVKSPPYEVGLKATHLWTIGAAVGQGVEVSDADLKSLELSDDDEHDMLVRLLGDTYAEMTADGLPWIWVRHAGITIMFWVVLDRAAAESFWESPGELHPAMPDPSSKEPSSAAVGPKKRRKPAAA